MKQFTFTMDISEELEQLKVDTKRKRMADVVSDALSLYKYLSTRIKDGDKIFIGQDKDGAQELVVTTLKVE